jgi:hypothetical protein
MRIKLLTYRLSAILIGVFLALLSLELLLRLGIIENKMYRQMSTDGVKNNPRHKILILGDSFIEKQETRTGLYELLEKGLSVYNAEILNTAVCGMGPLEYLTKMETSGMCFKPDIVLLFYYVGNDLTDVKYRLDNSGGLKRRIKDFVRPRLGRSYLYNFYVEKSNILRLATLDYEKMMKMGADKDLVMLAKEKKINPWLLHTAMKHKNMILENILMDQESDMKAWEASKAIIHKINVLCKRSNARFFMIIFPDSVQVDDSHFDFLEKCGFYIDRKTLVTSRPEDLLKGFCGEENIGCLDLLPYFRIGEKNGYYLKNDNHLSAKGRAFSKIIIMDFIRKQVKA